MANPNDKRGFLEIDWYDIFLWTWAIGILMKKSREFFYFFQPQICHYSKINENHVTRSFSSFKDNFLQITNYKVLQMLCCTCILLGHMFKIIGFKHCISSSDNNRSTLVYECKHDNLLEHSDDSLLKASYTMIGFGATLSILNLLRWFELNSYLGPIMISLRKTIADIFRILTTFLVFLFAFSTGLHFSLRFSNIYCEDEHKKVVARFESVQDITSSMKEIMETNLTGYNPEEDARIETNMTGFNLEDNVNHFRLFKEALKTCFWSLFDPGHPEVIGCTQVIA